jgi:hypothetical protein
MYEAEDQRHKRRDAMTWSWVNPVLTGAALARPGFSLLSLDHSRVARPSSCVLQLRRPSI